MQTYNTVQDNIFVHESTTDSQASFIFESDEETGQKVKRRPWETIQEALQREAREKEVARLQKLMKYAFPRRREEHLYKKKLLNPEDFNMSVDLIKLKKESMRLDKEKSIANSSVFKNPFNQDLDGNTFSKMDSVQ